MPIYCLALHDKSRREMAARRPLPCQLTNGIDARFACDTLALSDKNEARETKTDDGWSSSTWSATHPWYDCGNDPPGRAPPSRVRHFVPAFCRDVFYFTNVFGTGRDRRMYGIQIAAPIMEAKG
jgi:hypothetical protein